jgi:hypothetical protein
MRRKEAIVRRFFYVNGPFLKSEVVILQVCNGLRFQSAARNTSQADVFN